MDRRILFLTEREEYEEENRILSVLAIYNVTDVLYHNVCINLGGNVKGGRR